MSLREDAKKIYSSSIAKLDPSRTVYDYLSSNSIIDSHFEKITWAALINDLKKGDSEMEKIAFEEFEKLEFIYAIQGWIFMDLIKFDSPRINKRIEEFVDHKYDLVAHHAKMVLNYNGFADSINKKYNESRWWEFWK